MYRTSGTRGAKSAAVLSALTLLMTACGGDTGTDTAAEDSDTGTVQWWSWNPNAEESERYIEAFEAAHPDIDIEHRYIAYTDYVNTLRLALTSGEGPDVFGLQVGAMTQSFAPLAEDLTPRVEESLGAEWRDELLQVDQLNVDDKQVGLPWMITGAGLLWHNKTLLDQAGVAAPTTLDELQDACSALAEQQIGCVVHGGKDAWVNIDVFQTLANDYAPGLFYEAVAGEADWTSPELVEALETFQGLFDDGVFQEGALGTAQYPDANDAFTAGEAGFIVLGSWNSAAMTTTGLAAAAETTGNPGVVDFEFLPTSFPDVNGDGESSPMFGGPDVGWAMASRSDAKGAAYTFIDWLTSQPEGQALMGAQLQQPALRSEAVDTSDLAFPSQEAAVDDIAERLNDLIGARQLPDPDLETALGDALSAVASGTQSPAEALAAVQSVSETLDR
jgi:raffinose/stachyose/melibiose transport system substrate-binding protein